MKLQKNGSNTAKIHVREKNTTNQLSAHSTLNKQRRKELEAMMKEWNSGKDRGLGPRDLHSGLPPISTSCDLEEVT